MKNLLQRRSIRLYEYDYSHEGLYFITICTQNRICFLGSVVDEEMVLNDAGKMIEEQWLGLKNNFANVELHEYCIMPNHFHGIIEIVGVSLVDTRNDESYQKIAEYIYETPKYWLTDDYYIQ